MAGVGVITNPMSRQNLRNPRLARQLGYILGEKGPLAQPTSREDLAATALKFREHAIDLLCVNGGDGTLHTALTAMVKAYDGRPLPKIVILRGGTMNTIAHGLGIKGTPAEILDYVVTRYHADEPMPTVRRWLLDVDGEQYGFLFGNGLIAKFLEVYYEGAEPSPAKAAWLLGKVAFSAMVDGPLIRKLTAAWPGRVEVDGIAWPDRPWLTVAVGTVDDIGLGFRPFYLAPRHPGKFHALGIATSPWGVVKELPRIFRARPPASTDFVHQVGDALVLRSDEPIHYMVDGDFHRGGQTVTLRTGPSVDIVVPV